MTRNRAITKPKSTRRSRSGEPPGMRAVDWPLIEGALAVAPTTQVPPAGRLQALLLFSRALPEQASLLELGFAAVAGARNILELDRVALFLREKSGRFLSGLVGTSSEGHLTDERSIRHAVDPADETLWADLRLGKRSFELLDNAPLVAHARGHSRVIGRSWFVKTPIVDGDVPLGFFYNDSARSLAKFDAERQECLAAFAAFFAARLRGARDRSWPLRTVGLSSEVAECLELLVADPSASEQALARRLGITTHRLSRAFHEQMKVPLKDYRTEIRLERFFRLVEAAEHAGHPEPLLDLALEAGFGSYSQFHRVFSARFGRSPTRYLNP